MGGIKRGYQLDRGKNLADLADAPTARGNLGLGTAAIKNEGEGSGLNADKLDGFESSDFQRIVPSVEQINLPTGWYTIAITNSSRAVARFGLRDVDSGDHQSCIFYASHKFGKGNEVTVLHASRFGSGPFGHIRIISGGDYDGAMLQVYIDQADNKVQVFLLADNFQATGWEIRNFVDSVNDPGGVRNFGNLIVENLRVNLGNIADGGMATSGEIYAGGDTNQYPVWHEANAQANYAAVARAGAIGTYAFLESTTSSTYHPGTIVYGSYLRYSNGTGVASSTSAPGSWRCMGYSPGTGHSTLWLRVT